MAISMATATATGNHQIQNKIQLPLDMVVDILSRLSVKSIKRFRCVAKSWGFLIQSPEFIYAHYSFSSNNINKVCPLIMYSNVGDKRVCLISNRTQSLEVVADFVVPPFAVSPPDTVEMVGCCNGIVCLRDFNSSAILLWNPASREDKIVHFYHEADFKQICKIRGNDVIGFGYDPKTKDYKLVRLESDWNSVFEFWGIKGVTLYSLTTNSWTDLDYDISSILNIYSEVNRLICINEFCHFSLKVDKEASILSFDFSKGVFIITPYPDEINSGAIKFSYFSCMDGSLGMMCSPNVDVDCRWYHVWMLGEMGIKNSWIKLFKIGPISYLYTPLGSISNCTIGEIFFTTDEEVDGYIGDDLLLRHQHPSSKQEIIQLEGFALGLEMYAESLVSLI